MTFLLPQNKRQGHILHIYIYKTPVLHTKGPPGPFTQLTSKTMGSRHHCVTTVCTEGTWHRK